VIAEVRLTIVGPRTWIINDVVIVEEQVNAIVQDSDSEVVVIRDKVMEIALKTAGPVPSEIGNEGSVVAHQSDIRFFQRDVKTPIPLSVPAKGSRHSDSELARSADSFNA
jgi:hypothetical protein